MAGHSRPVNVPLFGTCAGEMAAELYARVWPCVTQAAAAGSDHLVWDKKKGAGRLRGGEAASGLAPDARGVAWLRRAFR